MVARDQYVVRLDIPMDDSVLMGVSQPVRHVTQDPDGFADGLLPFPGQLGAEGFAFHEWHGVVEQAIGLAGGMEGHDVGVLKLGCKLDFSPEALDAEPGGEVWRQDLQHDLAAELQVFSNEHTAHPTATQLALDAVLIA